MKRLFLGLVSVLALSVASGCQSNSLKPWELRIENHVPSTYLSFRMDSDSLHWKCLDPVLDNRIVDMSLWSNSITKIDISIFGASGHILGDKIVFVLVPTIDRYDGPFMPNWHVKPDVIVIDRQDIEALAQLATQK
jgi:hypothetical protein